MSWLLDTNVVRALRRTGDRRTVDAVFRRWASRRPAGVDSISSLTLLELDLGVRRLERRDEEAGRRARYWLEEQVMAEFAGRVLPVDEAVARRAAGLDVPGRESLLAATAMVHGLGVATASTRAFSPYPVRVLNPWQLQ